jgi:hypothetical protein
LTSKNVRISLGFIYSTRGADIRGVGGDDMYLVAVAVVDGLDADVVTPAFYYTG